MTEDMPRWMTPLSDAEQQAQLDEVQAVRDAAAEAGEELTNQELLKRTLFSRKEPS